MGVEHVFITHGHLDHCGAIFTHARLRGRDLPPAKAKGAFEELGEDELPMEIVPIQPGEEVSIGNGCYVAPFPTAHRVPSQGYIIRDRRPRGLKPEYQGLAAAALKELRAATARTRPAGGGAEGAARDNGGLPTAALKELRAAGVEVGQLTDTVEVAFTGDTSFAPLLEQEEIWRAKILILEDAPRYASAVTSARGRVAMTYLDGTLDGAVKWCHTHLSEVAASAHRFSGVRELIACHVTARKSRFDAMRLLRKALPRDLAERTSVMLRLFGADEEVTRAVRLLREALPRDLAARTGVMLRLFGADEAVTPVCDPAS
ncbi:beta-lactamase-like protein [Tribonema minus]|uniref:Beta-lactamase-like protein n=1 Tax=Tribonema minus TaxID=303371 RepID=A0A835Z2Q2_9STRA|nr:beta-lactamase-like protein [Tribonema minus]